MEPEIARRCKSCGAAIRARSAFCPQCGAAQTEGEAPPAPASAPSAAAEASQRKATDSRQMAETMASTMQGETPVETETPAPEGARMMETPAVPAAPVETPLRADAAAPAPGVASSEAATEKRQRVTPAMVARGAVEDGGRNRAEKLRRASNVVLDEAAADPSLRFVLVATALILISVLILLLARVL
jgi:hypothetical protein